MERHGPAREQLEAAGVPPAWGPGKGASDRSRGAVASGRFGGQMPQDQPHRLTDPRPYGTPTRPSPREVQVAYSPVRCWSPLCFQT